MSFTVQNVEFYLLVLLRISAFVMTAPFFSYSTIPHQLKAALSIMLTLIVLNTIPVVSLSYQGVFGYSVLVLKETVIGLILGFMCSMCMYIISFAGQMMDTEMGLAMSSMFDPLSNIQVTVTGNIYNYLIMLMLLVTNMHYYIIRAITDSFKMFNVGEGVFRTNAIKELAVDFMGNYFLIAFRIVLPVFCCMLLINVVLGVLTKAAPQMNMFVIGIQIKVFVGIILLVILVQTIPTVSDYIFKEMREVISQVLKIFTP
ncbi:MAG: flagellar type III secretion system protein FliR [Eubacterium sp.]|nr:flagellar type III secretion system protein FliR [Eubacterium sp.]